VTTVSHRLDDVDHAPSVVTIGVFDGVHRGHRMLLSRTVDAARDRDVRSVVVTFDRNPLEVVRPGQHPPALQVLEDKVASLVATEVDHVHVLAFDRAASQEAPEDFVGRVLAGPLEANRVVVGEDFRFGHRAAGDVDLLTAMGEDLGFDVDAVALVVGDDGVVSSSAVRAAIAAGDVEAATAALGRPHRLVGRVVPGDGRGRTIGVPTANVDVVAGLAVPATGVYATRVARREPDGPGTTWDAVTNVGTRPTFDGEGITVESHLLDVDVDLYGAEVVVDLVARLRGEQRFDGVEDLVAQIHRDIEHGREVLA